MFHYAEGEVTHGPVPLDGLRGRIGPNTLVWREGMAEWKLAFELPELSEILSPLARPVDDLQLAPAAPAIMAYAHPQLAKTTPGLAVASMVLGIVAVPIMCLWPVSLVCALLALLFGLISWSQCTREDRPGRGMALTGIILGSVPFLMIVAFVAIIIVAAISSS